MMTDITEVQILCDDGTRFQKISAQKASADGVYSCPACGTTIVVTVA